ncbi:ragulator complex protein LAMTOR1-like [Halichondria panicea]|uniref:ragulator complex protein LAMTOR1-like n=1 Tax=Halichondria panicea TaxID=6063 RepID=UPI00312BBEFC
MGCLESKDTTDGPDENTRLLGNQPTPVQPIPHSSSGSGNHITKTDEESALNRILQRAANDVIDVTVVEPHSMETAEVRGRTRDYHSQVASMRGVSRPTQKLPSSDQPPNVMLSKELVSPTDVRFITDRTEATDAALQSMEIKGGEPLVVQFAAP